MDALSDFINCLCLCDMLINPYVVTDNLSNLSEYNIAVQKPE